MSDLMAAPTEVFISVDIETAGPIPGKYSMLSLGACVVEDGDAGFYAEFQPITDNAVPEALKVSALSMEELAINGMPPGEAMEAFRSWIETACGPRHPVFVAFNAGFDWSFVNWYFHTFVGQNPFGISSLDIKSYYMGRSGCTWRETRKHQIPAWFQSNRPHTHNALDDAYEQAEMFAKMLAVGRRPPI